MQVFQQRYRGARADLGVESEGAAELVGIPVRRRNPRVGPGHFHAGRTGLGGGLVHGGRDDRQRPVFGVQSVDVQLRDRCRRRVVAADQKADHGRMVAEQSRLARHGRCSHLLVRGVPRRAARLGPRLPFVAAFPAGEDHDAVTVGEVVESRVLELALAAQGIEPQVHDVAELGLHALGVLTQEQVRRPARAANQHRLAVDDKLLISLRGEVGTDAADAERRGGPVGDRTVDGSRHLQAVERMRTHADRPPDLWMVEIEARIALRGKGHGLRLIGIEVDRPAQRNTRHDARDRGLVGRGIEVSRLHCHGKRGAGEIGKRQRRGYLRRGDLDRPPAHDVHAPPGAHVVVGRRWVPVDPADR